MIWAGIDYGSKLVGTTCVAWLKEGQLKIIQSAKNQDADEWILTQLENESMDQIFMDAPLSLPPAFHDPLSDEFFYRAADRALKAMSPMFLGGLTARAMRLKKIWTSKGLTVLETYPAALARELALHDYKNNLSPCTAQVSHLLKADNIRLASEPQNWHQFDALLAWCAGMRWNKNQARVMGDDAGRIII